MITLKASGIATELTQCFAADGSTIKEMVSGATIGSGLTMVGSGLTTGSRAWNSGSTVHYIQTDGTNGFSVTSPPTCSNTFTVMMVFAELTNCTNAGLGGISSGSTWYIDGNGSGLLRCIRTVSGSASCYLNTAITTTRAASIAMISKGDPSDAYYALEGATASSAEVSNPTQNISSETGLGSWGYVSGGVGTIAAKLITAFVLPRAITLSEYNAIHGDPWGTLFDVAAGSGVPVMMNLQRQFRS